MTIHIPEHLISGLLVGTSAVLAMIAIGCFIAFLLRDLATRLPYTRIGLALALAPLGLFSFLGGTERIALLAFSAASALLGFCIDGISHLSGAEKPSTPPPARSTAQEPDIQTAHGTPAWENAAVKCVLVIAVLLIIMAGLSMSKFEEMEEEVRVDSEESRAVMESLQHRTEELHGVMNEQVERGFIGTERLLMQLEQRLDEAHNSRITFTRLVADVISRQEALLETLSNNESAETNLYSDVGAGLYRPDTFPEGSRFLPLTTNLAISIDANFPLESYQRMNDELLSETDRKAAEEQFLQEIKSSPRTFWTVMDSTLLRGHYRKEQSLEIVDTLETELLRKAIEELLLFIENNCQPTAPDER